MRHFAHAYLLAGAMAYTALPLQPEPSAYLPEYKSSPRKLPLTQAEAAARRATRRKNKAARKARRHNR